MAEKRDDDDPVGDALKGAKSFLAGLESGGGKPWDSGAKVKVKPHPKPSPSPNTSSSPTTPADSAQGQAEHFAKRNRWIADKTRRLRD